MKSLKQSINESFVNEVNQDIIDLYSASDSEASKIRRKLKQSSWTTSDIDKALKKYETAVKNAPKPTPKVKWNARKYDAWIKSVASNGGAEHAFDMAQNAKMEPGLIDYVRATSRKNFRDEDPMERIQWDIEAHA